MSVRSLYVKVPIPLFICERYCLKETVTRYLCRRMTSESSQSSPKLPMWLSLHQSASRSPTTPWPQINTLNSLLHLHHSSVYYRRDWWRYKTHMNLEAADSWPKDLHTNAIKCTHFMIGLYRRLLTSAHCPWGRACPGFEQLPYSVTLQPSKGHMVYCDRKFIGLWSIVLFSTAGPYP